MIEQLKALVAELIALGVLGLIAYYALKHDAQTTIPSAAQVSQGVSDIIKGAPSAVISAIKGQNDSTYITTEQQRALAQQYLMQHEMAQAALGN